MSKVGEKVGKALEDQFNKEMYASNLYLQMGFWFESEDWEGSAHWMFCQAKEEREHALLIASHLLDREWKVTFNTLHPPKNTWNSLLEVWNDALEHEVIVTNSIKCIADTAQQEKDHQSMDLCYKFLNEQIEEEDTLNKIIKKVKSMGNNLGFYVGYDKVLGDRS